MTLAAEPHPAPPQQPTVAWSEPDVDRRVEFWPTVAIRSALESGDIATWQRIAAALKRDPTGGQHAKSKKSSRAYRRPASPTPLGGAGPGPYSPRRQ